MKNNLLSASVLAFGLVVSSLIVTNGAFAQTAEDSIQFPIAELGGCKDKESCKTYCDDESHLDACLAFAEKNSLMSGEELSIAKKFAAAGAKGPGGCTGKDECEMYCDDINHIDACVAFAEKTGILPPEQLAEAKQVQAAIAKGVKPPACRGKKECDAYCENPGNMKECIAFGEASGFLKGRELDDAKKMITAIENGATPPACRGREACEAYCSEPDNMEACMTFAQAAGFMTPEEAQNSEKMLVALRKGVKPPACRGKEECDTYCSDSAHADECIQFAVAAGFMNEKEAEISKRTGGKGPGGCVGKDACEAFCGDPNNQDTCISFAKDNGMISEEDAGRMQEGQKKFRESMQSIPPEVEGCLKTALGDDAFEKMKSGQAMPTQDTGEKMGFCFSQMGPPQGQDGRQGEELGQEGRERMQSPQGQEQLGRPEQFMQIEGEPGQIPPYGQRPPDGQRPPEGQWSQEGQRPPEGEFAPGMYPNQPPPEEQTQPDVGVPSSAYQEQYQEQYQQQYQQEYQQQYQEQYQQTQFVPGGEMMTAPPAEQSVPIEPTAPQSSNFDLNSSLASVWTAFIEVVF